MTITVGKLIEELSQYPKEMEIHFEGFEYYRLKQRGENLLQIELNVKENEDE